MKKFLISFVMLLICASSLMAQGAPSVNEMGSPYTFTLDRNFANGMLDTLQAVDSITLLNKVALASDKDYILRVGRVTGSGNDSVEAIVVIDYFGNAGDTTLIYRQVVDTVLTALGEAIILPINRSGWAKYYTAKFIGGAKNGGVVIMNNVSLVTRKIVK